MLHRNFFLLNTFLFPVQKTENTAVGIRHSDHVALCPQKLALTSPTSGCSSVGVVRSRTQVMELFLYFPVTPLEFILLSGVYMLCDMG
jgi:hypothetical protein